MAFGFDIIATASLIINRLSPDGDRPGLSLFRRRFFWWSASTYFGLNVIVLGSVFLSWDQSVNLSSAPLTSGDLHVVEPSKWVGDTIPILSEISGRLDLAHGDWTVLFFRHDCSDCEDAIAKYAAIVGSAGHLTNGSQFALVEVPPYGTASGRPVVGSYAQLSGKERWFLQTPLEVFVKNGRVQSASHDLPELRQMSSAQFVTHETQNP